MYDVILVCVCVRACVGVCNLPRRPFESAALQIPARALLAQRVLVARGGPHHPRVKGNLQTDLSWFALWKLTGDAVLSLLLLTPLLIYYVY